MASKYELVQLVVPEDLRNKLDYALPQGWADEVRKLTGSDPVPHLVWMYDGEGGIFGRPYSLTPEGWVIVQQANMAMGTEFPER